MRVYKLIFAVAALLYILSLGLSFILVKQSGMHEKRRVLNQLDIPSNSKSRIILFGSSSCYLGLSANSIQNAMQIPTYNLCHPKFDTQEHFKELLTHLNNQDVVIYALRLSSKKPRNDILPAIRLNFTDFFIPELNEIYKRFINQPYNEKGDLINYKPLQKIAFPYPASTMDQMLIKNILERQLTNISNVVKNSDVRPRIIVVAAPMLTKTPNLELERLKLEWPLPDNIDEWFPPLMITNKDEFVDQTHLNDLGRAEWTSQLIIALKHLLLK